MNEKQLADYQIWKQNPEQPLPESLENVFIERCLEELKNNAKARYQFNIFPSNIVTDGVYFNHTSEYALNWAKTSILQKKEIILTLLSRTLDDRCDCCMRDDNGYQHEPQCTSLNPVSIAVMPFLDVPIQALYQYRLQGRIMHYFFTGKPSENNEELNDDDFLALTPPTLDHLLYREFTEALRVGKTFDQALEIITKTYLLNRYE